MPVTSGALREDGWLPLREYAAIGDGRTLALVGRDGSIDWLCLPDLDSESVFARLLDRRHGGFFALAPVEPANAVRRYLPETNVLETTYTTAGGAARVVEALTLPLSGLPPTRELVRRVEGLAGRVAFEYTLEPRFGYGLGKTRLERRGSVPVAVAGADAIALAAWDAGEPRPTEDAITGAFEVETGRSALLVLAHAHGEPLVLPRATTSSGGSRRRFASGANGRGGGRTRGRGGTRSYAARSRSSSSSSLPRARSRPPPRRRFPRRSAAGRTTTTATPGSATPPSRWTPSPTSAAPRRPTRSSPGSSTPRS